MVTIFDTNIYYISVQEVKDSTNKTELSALTDEEIKTLIVKAEISVNDYLWYVMGANIINQTDQTKQDFKIATFYVVEQIFVNNDLIKKVNSNWVVSSESSWDRSVSFETNSKTNNLKILWINEFAKKILDKYRKIFFKQVI